MVTLPLLGWNVHRGDRFRPVNRLKKQPFFEPNRCFGHGRCGCPECDHSVVPVKPVPGADDDDVTDRRWVGALERAPAALSGLPFRVGLPQKCNESALALSSPLAGREDEDGMPVAAISGVNALVCRGFPFSFSAAQCNPFSRTPQARELALGVCWMILASVRCCCCCNAWSSEHLVYVTFGTRPTRRCNGCKLVGPMVLLLPFRCCCC